MRLRRQPQPQTVQSAHVPAPLGGMNSIASALGMPAGDCLVAYNLIPDELGLRARLGYLEWCTGMTGAADNTVRTTIPFRGSRKNGAGDKLFAVTSTGIWDVTTSSASPTQLVTFATQSGDAGWGVYTVMATAAGRFILYADEENGLHVYTESTDTWAAVTEGGGAGQISGVNPANLVHVTVWKSRVWLTEKDTSKAWYLDINAVFGTATSFNFGPRMRSGGPLVGLYNWSYDGGSGMDTLLVGISAAGDIVIYQGTDPSSADTFGIKGTWSVGGVPAGRTIATDYGGDVLIISQLGVLPLSRLVVGNAADDKSIYATAKISNLFASLVNSYRTLRGWSLHIHPSDNALLVTVPTANGAATVQLVMSFATKGWFRYRGLPILSAGVWNGELYFGTADGRVCRNSGYLDNVLLSNSDSWTAVAWSLITASSNLRNQRHKQVVMTRPRVSSETPSPRVEVTPLYDLDSIEPTAPSGNGGGGDGAWDSSTWDSSTWGGAEVTNATKGATGVGREVALAIQGNAISKTTLVGVDVYFREGGSL